MDTAHVNWLLEELNVLVQKGVISSEASKRISDYYSAKSKKLTEEHAVQENPAEPVKSDGENIYQTINEQSKKSVHKTPSIRTEQIPVILSVIASILIAAGIISLIAYNWNAIPRFAKAVAAFVMLLAVQALGTAAMFKKKFQSKKYWKEGAAVLWSLLFGGTVAFISQICRLPGNTSAFLLVWAVSSILVLYAMHSTGVFFFALVQSIAYAFECNHCGGGAFVFYLLFAALVPFARTKKYGVPLMLCVAAIMLAVVLEKGIPGLWIVCSVSFAVLCLEYGIWKKAPLIKRLAAAGLCLLLLALTSNDLWHYIGWQFVRSDCNTIGTVLDCVLALCLTGAAVAVPAVPVLRRIKKPSYRLVYPLCVLTVALLYIVCSCMPKEIQRSSLLAPTVIVYLLVFLFFIHALYSKVLYSVFLMAFIMLALPLAHFTNLIFAAVVLLLVLEGLRQYRIQKDGRASAVLCYSVVRVLAFVLLALLAYYNTSWYTFSAGKSAAGTASHLVLYALCALGAGHLLRKAGGVKHSADIIFTAVALCLLFTVNAFTAIEEQTVCFLLLCIEFTASMYDFCLLQSENKTSAVYFWAPFSAVAAYYFCSNLHFNYPVLAACSFLLMMEALGRYRARQSKVESCILYGFVRLGLTLLFIAIGFLDAKEFLTAVSAPASAPFQLAVYAIYTAAGVVLLVLSKRWKESLDALVFIAVMALLVLKNNDVLYFTVSLCASAYGFYQWKKKGSAWQLPYLLLLLVNQYAAQRSLFASGAFFITAVPLCALLYFYSTEKTSALAMLAEAACAVILFAAAFKEIRCEHLPYDGGRDYPYMISNILHTFLYAVIVLLPAAQRIAKRVVCNYTIILYTIALFILTLICEFIPLTGGTLNAGKAGKIFLFLSFITIFVYAGYYIVRAYRTDSIALANAAGGYASLAIIIRFFSDEYSFVAKGVIFIILGICMLLLNVFLLNLNKKRIEAEADNE